MENIIVAPSKRTSVTSTNNENCEDRFSLLPECILFMIVSLIPFRDAARFSCLGHGWSRAWRAMKKIDFNEIFFTKCDTLNSLEEKENRRNNFMNFARNWIEQYQDKEVDEYKLVITSPQKNYLEVNNLIQFGISREVKHLDLDFSSPFWESGTIDGIGSTCMHLPPSYEGHEKLESLRLFSCFIDLEKFNSFPSLKTISLGWITLEKDISIQMLMSKCPCLESLSLINVYNIGTITIFAPRLKKFVVENCYKLTNMTAHGPCLESFMYSGKIIQFIIDLPNDEIEEVVLDFGQEKTYDIYNHGHYLYHLLIDVIGTRALTICSYILQAFSDPQGLLALTQLTFANVQHLTINCGLEPREFSGISFFLHSCTSLEVLTINIGVARVVQGCTLWALGNNHPFHDPNQIPESYDCLKNTLKVVVLNEFKGSRNDYFVLQYLCNYGKVLEKVYVNVANEMENDVGFIDSKLNSWKTASPVQQLFCVKLEEY